MTAVVPPTVPPPPPGPGVQAPFVAPPTDGARRRRGWAVGLSIGAAVLVCVAGVAGAGGFLALAAQAVRDQAESAVEDYLGALRDEKYDQAYALICDPLQARTPLSEFASAQRDQPTITGFEVGGASLSEDITVPARVEREDGTVRSVRYYLLQDRRTAELEVCGEAD